MSIEVAQLLVDGLNTFGWMMATAIIINGIFS